MTDDRLVATLQTFKCIDMLAVNISYQTLDGWAILIAYFCSFVKVIV